MTIIDYSKIADALIKKIHAEVKKVKGCHVSDFLKYDMGEHEYGVQISTCSPEYICDVISNVIRKSKYGIVIREESHVGHFDWASDTYIKDCAVVEFKVK